MKTRFQEKLEGMKRPYYEFFGDLQSDRERWKIISFFLIALLFLDVVQDFRAANQLPFVIHVNEVGKAEAIKDIRSNNQVADLEILDFARTFVNEFRGLNSYTLPENSSKAWNRMTTRFQKIANRDLIDSGFFARFDKTGLYARIEIKEEKIERQTDKFAFVSLIGVRTILNYNDPSYREASLFKADLVLKKVPRTKNAIWGLLVEDFRETILNKLEESK